MEHFCETVLNLEQCIKEMLFKDISYLELRQSLCSEDWNFLCNFGRVHHEEQFCFVLFDLILYVPSTSFQL